MHNWLTLEGLTTQCVIWLREGGGQRENLWGHSVSKELHEGTGEEFLKQGAPYGLDSGSHHDQLCSCHTAHVTHFPLSASGQLGEGARHHVGQYPMPAGSQQVWALCPGASEKKEQVGTGPSWSDSCRKSKQFLEDCLKCPAPRAKGNPENSDLRKLQAF